MVKLTFIFATALTNTCKKDKMYPNKGVHHIAQASTSAFMEGVQSAPYDERLF